MKNIKFKISNFNKYLVFLIGSLFLYLFYLSIPTLFNKDRVQKHLSNKLIEDFKINFSISSEINYSILPSPHFFIKDTKVYSSNLESPKELVQIKDLKIFVSQKNFINPENLKINRILINHANFLIEKNDMSFFEKFKNEKFGYKEITIKNSNIFYKNKNKETISIFSISNLKLFYDKKKDLNIINSKGEIFKIPFNLNWNRNFNEQIKKTTKLQLKKLNFNLKNESLLKNEKYYSTIETNIRNSRIMFDYQILEDLIIFKSNYSKLTNDDIKFEGSISSDPFYLDLNIDLKTLNLSKLLSFGTIFNELLKTNLFFNKNLSADISLNSRKITKNKLFDKSKIFLRFNNGKINFDTSYFVSEKIGVLDLYKSSLENINNELFFFGSFDFKIKKENQFYSTFQIPKNNRRKTKNIYFDIEYNLFSDELNILSFRLNDLSSIQSQKLVNFLDDYNNDNDKKIKNWIDLKKIVNKFIINYEG